MKTLSIKAKLINCFFALTLVTGLCVPSIASYAYAEPVQGTTINLATDTRQTNQSVNVSEEQANTSENAGEPNASCKQNQTTQAEGMIQAEEVQQTTEQANQTGQNNAAQQDDKSTTLPAGALTNTNQQFGLTIMGGTPGVDYYFISEDCVRPARTGSYKLQDTLNKLVIIGSAELTIANDVPETATNATIWVAPGTQARVVFDNVNINAPVPCHIERNKDDSGATIEPKTSLHITLAKGSDNTLKATDGRQAPAIHCGEGTKLTIDDDVPNVTTSGEPIVMNPSRYPGKIPAGITFVGNDGITRTAGATAGDDRLSLLENPNTNTVGKLKAYGALRVAAIGSVEYENTGEMIFDGGNIYADAAGRTDGTYGFGAAIGGGGAGSGGTLVFNGGTVETYTSYHAASIGGGAWAYLDTNSAYQFEDTLDNGLVKATVGSPDTVPPASATSQGSKTCAGDIFVNGGLIIPHASLHGNAIGKGCCSYNRDHVIVIAGGTVLPDTSNAQVPNGDPKKDCVAMAIGAAEGAVSVVGGSVRIGKVTRPNGSGGTKENEEKYEATINGADSYSTAYGIYPINPSLNTNPTVEMIAIDLSSEVITTDDAGNKLTDGNNKIIDWELTINGKHQEYGSPAQLTDGKLYLWLPASAKDKLVSVELSYIDNNGDAKKIEPLFRNPNEGSLLKRYIDFKLSDTEQGAEYERTKLTKDYDGLPFEPYDLKTYPIKTDEAIPKTLDKPDMLSYRYQLYTERGDNGQPIGEEISTGANMPSNEGIMKLTMVSTQFSNVDGFKENYWGHRATTWCEIKPVPSQITNLKATWSNNDNGDVFHPAEDSISVDAIIKGGYFDDDPTKPTAATCKAPEGQVQLYVDNEAVGDPVDIVFPGSSTTPSARVATIQADAINTQADDTTGDSTSKIPNAERVDNGQGGSYTHFTYTFTPSKTDHLVPNATKDGKHQVSLRYLPSINYLMSANPENKDEKAPEVEVAIQPVDPEPTVEQGPSTSSPDPDDPSWPTPEVKTNADPDPDDSSNPGNPGTPDDPSDVNAGKTYRGTITTSYKPFVEGQVNPGRVILNIKTPSSGEIKVTDEAGNIITATAQVICDANGVPIVDADGKKRFRLPSILKQ